MSEQKVSAEGASEAQTICCSCGQQVPKDIVDAVLAKRAGAGEGNMRRLYDAACRAGLRSTEGRTFEEWQAKVSDFGLDDARQALLAEEAGAGEGVPEHDWRWYDNYLRAKGDTDLVDRMLAEFRLSRQSSARAYSPTVDEAAVRRNHRQRNEGVEMKVCSVCTRPSETACFYHPEAPLKFHPDGLCENVCFGCLKRSGVSGKPPSPHVEGKDKNSVSGAGNHSQIVIPKDSSLDVSPTIKAGQDAVRQFKDYTFDNCRHFNRDRNYDYCAGCVAKFMRTLADVHTSDSSKEYVRGLSDALAAVNKHNAKYDDNYQHCLYKCIPEEIQALISQHQSGEK